MYSIDGVQGYSSVSMVQSFRLQEHGQHVLYAEFSKRGGRQTSPASAKNQTVPDVISPGRLVFAKWTESLYYVNITNP
jgi:hypothetical protein